MVLKEPNGVMIEHSLFFKFKVSNNQAEYEALIVKLTLAKNMGVSEVHCKTNSLLVVDQVKGTF